MLELYLDQLNDLLLPPEIDPKSRRLELREDPHSGRISVLGVTTCQVANVNEALQIYR
jgi:hypothetical protein